MAGHGFSVSQLTWQPHELPQLTLPHAGSVPMHVAVHLSPPHEMVPHAALPPLHVSVHFEVASPPHICAAHAFDPVHVRVQSPVPLQFRLPQTCRPPPPEQVSVQLPVVQVSEPHAPEPLQVAEQLPLEHEMLPHAFVPVQSTVQLLVWHMMSRQALSAVQCTSHF